MEAEELIICFDYSLEECRKDLRLEATAELHPAKTHYLVHSFRRCDGKNDDSPATHAGILPRIEIRMMELNGKRTWVHFDSEKESQLSLVIGKAIEENQYIRLLKTV